MRLANLIHPTARNARQNKYDFYRIQAKCVDFVLGDLVTTKPRLVIEFDDASHQRADRQKRDAFVDAVLPQVGLPILHIPWQRSYNVSQLAEAIGGKLYGTAIVHSLPQTPEPMQPTAWATPIKLGVQPTNELLPSPTASLREVSYVCGQCQGQGRREATFCNQCGAQL